MAGLLDDIGQFLNSQMGQGLLSSAFAGMAGAGRGDPLNNLGRAGLAGIMGYQNAPTAQLRQMQAEETRRKLDDMDASRKALTEYYSNRGMPQSPAQAAIAEGASVGDIGPTVTNAARIPSMQGTGVTPKADVWQQYNDIGNMMAAKGLPEQAQQYYGLAEKFRPKYGTTPFVGSDGNAYLVGEDGTIKSAGVKGKTDVKDGYLVPDGRGGWAIDPILYSAAKELKATGAPKVTVPVNVSTEKKYGEQFAGEVAKSDMGLMEAAQRAPDLADRANRIKRVLESGKVITGFGADARLAFGKAAGLVGASDQETIANTEALSADLARNTLDAIKASGLGSGNGFSNADRDFLNKAAGGLIAFDSPTISRLADLSHRAAVQSASRWNNRVKAIPDSAIEGTGVGRSPVEVPPLYSGKNSAIGSGGWSATIVK